MPIRWMMRRSGRWLAARSCAPENGRRSRGHRAPAGRLPSIIRLVAYTSPHLKSFGEQLGFSVAVVAVTPDPMRHLARLVRDEHACWTMCEDWCFNGAGHAQEVDPFAPDFGQIRFDVRWMGGRRLPPGLAIENGSLLVVLPPDVAAAAYSAEVARRLAPHRFEAVAARPGQVLRRRMTGRPHEVVPRYSRPGSDHAGVTGFRLTTDLYRFRPMDLPAFTAAAAEARHRLDLAGEIAAVMSRPG